MTKMELINRIVENHNKIMNIEVHGESVIVLADTMYDLRMLIKQLQSDGITSDDKAQ